MKSHIVPLRSSDLVMSVIHKIDQLIATGSLTPQQRIVESEIGSLLGVGRVPVREAIRILAGEGVVELVPGKGARVKAVTPRSLIEMIVVQKALALAGLDAMFDAPDFMANARNLVALSGRIPKLVQQGLYLDAMALISEFHLKTVAASNNGHLISTFGRTRLHYHYPFILQLIGESTVTECASDYRGLADAIRRRDVPQAISLMTENFNRLLNAMRNSEAAGSGDFVPETSPSAIN